MKRTMQLFETIDGYENIQEANQDGSYWCDSDSDYFPISLPFEVNVTMLPVEDVTEKRIDNLETAKEVAHANWLTIAAAFDDKIAKLRALPHLPEAQS